MMNYSPKVVMKVFKLNLYEHKPLSLYWLLLANPFFHSQAMSNTCLAVTTFMTEIFCRLDVLSNAQPEEKHNIKCENQNNGS